MSLFPAEAKTIAVPVDEYRWLRKIYLESLPIRDKGVQSFHRLPPPMRLAIVSLALFYRAHGPDDRGPTPGGAT